MFTQDFSKALAQQQKIRRKYRVTWGAAAMIALLLLTGIGELFKQENAIPHRTKGASEYKAKPHDERVFESHAEARPSIPCVTQIELAYLGWVMNAHKQFALLMNVNSMYSQWVQVGESLSLIEQEHPEGDRWRVDSFNPEQVVLMQANCALTITLNESTPPPKKQISDITKGTR